jgi:hypothetical protein
MNRKYIVLPRSEMNAETIKSLYKKISRLQQVIRLAVRERFPNKAGKQFLAQHNIPEEE